MVHNKILEDTSVAVLSLFPPLSDAEQHGALTLYQLLAEGGPVACDDFASAARITRAQAERMLARWPDVSRGRAGKIIGFGGLTIAETRHRMELGGGTRYAWCAWDTLFIPALLGVPAKIESTCPVTGERIALTVHPEGIESANDSTFVSLVAPDPRKAVTDLTGEFCCHVHFLPPNAQERLG